MARKLREVIARGQNEWLGALPARGISVVAVSIV
jgi:hypothetical protein